MALKEVQHITWPEEKSQLPNPLISDCIIELSSEHAEKQIPDLLAALEPLDAVDFSLVVLVENSQLDSFPETINAVPSLQEAFDIIEMERIERDLGF